nr:PAS domain S-box protein [uncultured Desulfobacter sp.]
MKKTKSLRYHQSLQFALVAGLPVLIIAFLVWLFLLPAMQSDTKIRHQGMARSIAGQVSSNVLGGQRQLAALADFIQTRNGLSDQQVTRLLDSQCGEGELFETIYISSPRQQLVMTVGLTRSRRSFRRDLVGLDLSGRRFVKAAGNPEKPVWSETFMSTVSRRLAVALTIPMADTLITAEITLDNLSEKISQLPGKTGYLTYVIDRKGRIVADSQRLHWGQRLQGSLFAFAEPENGGQVISGSFELDGTSYLGTVVFIDDLGWKVLVAQPASKAYGPLRSTLITFVLGLTMASILALYLSWNRAKRLSRIFRAYGEKARAIADGRYDKKWPSSAITELYLLGQSLKHMAGMIDQREKELIENREAMKNLIANVPGIMYEFSGDPKHPKFNDASTVLKEKLRDLLGIHWQPEQLLNDFIACLPKEDQSRFVLSIQKAVYTVSPWHYEGRFIKPTGEEIWIECTSQPRSVGKKIIYYGFIMDSTRRKEMEESLRLTQFIFDKAPIGIWRMGPKGEILDVNEEGCASLDYSRKELRRMNVFDFDPAMDSKRWAQQIGILKDVGSTTIESLHRRKNGDIFPIQVIQKMVRYEAQDFHVAFVQDITQRKEAEEELRRLKNYLSNIIDSMPSVLVGVDHNIRVTQWNQQARNTTGLNFEEAGARHLTEVLPHLADKIEQIKTAIREHRVISSPKIPIKTKQEIRFEDVTIFPLTADGVEGAVIRVDDITEQVRLEEMMIQSEKMLSVGGLAAGMAHEINNPLAAMLQTANVVKSRLENIKIRANLKAAGEVGVTVDQIRAFMEKRSILRMLDAINESGQRVAGIVGNMLSFARKSDAAFSSHHPAQLIDKVLELAATDYNLKKKYDFKTIKILKEYEENLPMVPCEAAKIQQVLLNILRNGAQAMQSQDMADNDPPCFILRIAKEKNMLRIEIQDNGPGMDEATQSRIFEPFFTTKPVGEGTGLGLSVSYFIITQNHSGTLDVESSLKEGSNFIIRLPLERN